MRNICDNSPYDDTCPFDVDVAAGSIDGLHCEAAVFDEAAENDGDILSCYNCGRVIPFGDAYYVETGDGTQCFCPDCIDTLCFRCPDCDTYHLNEEYHIEYRHQTICNYCSSDYYFCDRCERYVYYENYNTDRDCCYDCQNEINTGVEDYHQNDDWEFIGECKPSWKGLWRGLGIELEIDRDEKDAYTEKRTVSQIRDIYDNLKFEYDGSLEYGFEIITQPHTVDEFYNIDWEAILAACKRNGYLSHSAPRCGLHIHFSRAMFGSSERRQAGNISKLINFFEAYWDDILKISRRTQKQADEYARRYGVTDINDVKKLGKSKNEGRYYAVNNSNRDTVEIRIMRGTLNIRTFLACIDFCITIVKNSRIMTWNDISDVTKWLGGLKPETRDYIRFRNAFMEVGF